MAAVPVGFVGLGRMGAPMAHRLHAAGHDLVVDDLAAVARDGFVGRHPGSRAAGGPAGFAGAEVVVTMLPSSDEVDAVVRGAPGRPGMIGVLRPGATLIDMGSSQPLRSKALAAELAGRGVRFLDAPVSGGVRRAVDGTLAIMVGGEAATLDAWRPLLAALGSTVTHVGPAGAGHALKALNNYVSAAGLVATCEAMLAARAFGIDPALAVDVIDRSTGRNNTTGNKARQFMLSGTFDSGFALALMAKDLGIACQLGAQLGAPMPLSGHVLSLWSAAARTLDPGADHTEMFRYLEQGGG